MENAPQCFAYPELTKAEHIALRSLSQGQASEYQQCLALRVIVNKFARAHDVLFVPTSDRESTFLEGRGFVGQMILKYLNLPVAKLPEQTGDHNETHTTSFL
jgi:hypothetical protein